MNKSLKRDVIENLVNNRLNESFQTKKLNLRWISLMRYKEMERIKIEFLKMKSVDSNQIS